MSTAVTDGKQAKPPVASLGHDSSVQREHQMRMRKLRRRIEPGDHVIAQRAFGGFDMFTHHGIYTGDGTVIHFYKGKIRNISLRKFGNGDDVWIKHHRNSRVFDPDEVIVRAQKLLGRRHYHLLDRNCEHFATWCVTNKAKSNQAAMLDFLPLVPRSEADKFSKWLDRDPKPKKLRS